MKKFLPKSINNPQGFTLVELLIVITIIGVLSVIAITIFGNVGVRARDSRRKEDIAAIASAMEANYNTAVVTSCVKVACPGQYCALDPCFFANGQIPIDPFNIGTTCSLNACKYCVKSGFPPTAGPCSIFDPTIAANLPPAGTSYLICASLETPTGTGGQNYECRKNQQ